MKRLLATTLLTAGLFNANVFAAETYKIDTAGMHAAIQFRVQHLGYSWLYGRFNDFSGTFTYDAAKPESNQVNVSIKTTSVDSNHAERDKHLRSADFLNVEKFPEATFKSTAYKAASDGKATIEGELTLNGVTKPVTLDVKEIGAGNDPWGGYRRGFEGTTRFALADFNITKDLGPSSKDVEMILSVEGIRD